MPVTYIYGDCEGVQLFFQQKRSTMLVPLEERIDRVLSESKSRAIDEEIFVGKLDEFSVDDLRDTGHKLIVRERNV